MNTLPPKRGWICSLRVALEMSQQQLADRLDVTQNTILNYERTEAAGTIRLDTLKRVAKELDCKLVYALVPKKSLEKTFVVRRFQIAWDRLMPNTKPRVYSAKAAAMLARACVEKLKGSRIW